MRIEREHTAALIVDFQERLVPAIADHEALMERVQILLQGLKALEIPMTVTQQYTKGLGMSVPAGAGYVPVLVTDCIGSRRESDREMAIRRAEQEGAVLTSSEAILFELLKEAGTPLSKEILKIVK